MIKKVPVRATSTELDARQRFVQMLKETPVMPEEILSNLFLYMPRQEMTRLLLLNHIYSKILDLHGVIMEFGTRWGRDLAIFQALRGIFEPYNYNRKIVGFDTFEGFLSIDKKDGKSDFVKTGAYNVTKNYEKQLEELMSLHERMSPIPQMKKFEIVKGDASVEVEKYLARNRQTIIALAFFDMDIYKPTRDCLKAIKPYLTKGSIIYMDEMNHPEFPGETEAFREVFGTTNFRVCRTPFSTVESYIVFE